MTDVAAPAQLKVLLVPDSIYWVTGTIALSIAHFNPWIRASVVSGTVLDRIAGRHPEVLEGVDLVHFLCSYSSRDWLPRLRDRLPVVTSHHHVTDWPAVAHNLAGDAIVTGSLEWAHDIIARGADATRVVTIPYGVATSRFTPATRAERQLARAAVGLVGQGPVIGFFGKASSNDDDRKGIDIFVKGVHELNRRIPDMSVLIVGPGWKSLVSDFRSRGVRCVWLPFVEDPARLPALYRALDFYWVTARVEGGPVPLLEAMSAGVCCLSTPVGLAREIVQHEENALLLPMNDPGAFADATAALWMTPERRYAIGTEARRTMLEKMDISYTSRRIVEAYASAVEHFRRRHPGSGIPDVHRLAAGAPSSTVSLNQSVPLETLGPALQESVPLLEKLVWSEHLVVYHGERFAALKLLLRAWMAKPASLQPARMALRLFLPDAIVRRIVSLRRARLGRASIDA